MQFMMTLGFYYLAKVKSQERGQYRIKLPLSKKALAAKIAHAEKMYTINLDPHFKLDYQALEVPNKVEVLHITNLNLLNVTPYEANRIVNAIILRQKETGLLFTKKQLQNLIKQAGVQNFRNSLTQHTNVNYLISLIKSSKCCNIAR